MLSNNEIPVLILAGGYGSRLSEKTNLIPKPMIKVGGLPIIHHIKGGNSYNGIPVEGRSQIFRFCDTLGKVLRECKWHLKEDYQGRKYRLHSIRKWHINKSIQGGEDRFQIADRVGHKYEVLHKFYLEKDAPQQMKADLGLQNPVMIKSNDAEAEETYS